MIEVLALQRIVHGVRDRAQAEEMYENILGARRIFTGFLHGENRDSTVYKLNNLGVQVLAAESDKEISDYIDRVGEGFCAVVLQVEDVGVAERHLADCGMEVKRVSDSFLTVHREGFFNVRYDLTDQPMPMDAGVNWTPLVGEFGDHPAGISNDASVTLFVPNVDEAYDRYSDSLGVKALEFRTGRIASGRSIRVAMGEDGVSLMEPRTERDVISRMIERQGVSGFHGVFFQVRDLGIPRKYFGSKGVGVAGGENIWAMPHPRMCRGARFMLILPPEDRPG